MSKNWSEKSCEEIEKELKEAIEELDKSIKPKEFDMKIFVNNKLNNKKNILLNRKQRRINANKFRNK